MDHEIEIEDFCGGFVITIDGKDFHFYDEEPVEDLVHVFRELGFENVEYEDTF